MTCQLLRLVIDTGQIFRAVAVSADLGNVADAEFSANFLGARIVTEKNNFDIWMQTLPATQGVALDHSDVSRERLRCAEKCDHRSRRSRYRS